MLKLLGTLGKGFATISGAVLAVVGIITGTHLGGSNDTVGEAVKTITAGVPAIIAALGVILAAFGIGRKAGAAANS